MGHSWRRTLFGASLGSLSTLSLVALLAGSRPPWDHGSDNLAYPLVLLGLPALAALGFALVALPTSDTEPAVARLTLASRMLLLLGTASLGFAVFAATNVYYGGPCIAALLGGVALCLLGGGGSMARSAREARRRSEGPQVRQPN